MKTNNLAEQEFWISAACELLTHTELRVFMVWFRDHIDFSASVSELNKRLPYLDNANIRKAVRGLREKKFVKNTKRIKSQNGGWDINFRGMWDIEVAKTYHDIERKKQAKAKLDRQNKKNPIVKNTGKNVNFIRKVSTDLLDP